MNTSNDWEERFYARYTTETLGGAALEASLLDFIREVVTQEIERSYEEGKKFQRELHRTWLPAARKNYAEGVQAGREAAVEYIKGEIAKVEDYAVNKLELTEILKEVARSPKP